MRSVAASSRFSLALLGSAGCGLLPGREVDETAGWSANKLYAEAKDAMSDGAYDKAIKYYEKLEARYPYGRYAQQAQLEVAYAYYKQQRAGLGDRRLRPLHPPAPEPSERRLRLLPQGPGQLQRGSRPARQHQRRRT